VAYLVGNALMSDPLWTAITFLIILAGVPVYYAAFRPTDPRAYARGSR
jgi:hypothetical protein